MYKKIFQKIKEKSLQKKAVFDSLYKSEEHAVLARQPHFIFSAENPMYPENHTLNLNHEKVVKMLKGKGYKVEEARGHYGQPERAIIVHNPSNYAMSHLRKLATQLGQESSISSDGYNHEMHFHGGPNEGLHVKGQGTTFHKRKPDDHFTELNNGTSFSHVFNFDEAHSKDQSRFIPKDLSTKKSEVDFVKSEPNHPLIGAGPDTKLIHFSTTAGLKSIDPKFQGQRIRDASSKYGKPEHPVSFYYLEGAKPEALVANGSKSKYVARLAHHKVYDLGTDPEHIRSQLREASKNRQVNPNSFTRDELDEAIKARGYHGIYNSAHEQEDMRKVVGMYHALPVEKEVPYHPKDAERATDQAYEQHHSLNKSMRRFFIDEEELEDLEKAGVVSPSKHIGLKRLQQIQTDHNLGAGGKDYSAEEVQDAIHERSNAQANKVVSLAGKREKEMANRAQEQASGVAGPAFPPPMPRKTGVGVKPTPITTHNENIRAVADKYAQSRGLKLNHNIPQSKVDPKNAAKIADAYHNAQHMPNDPHVKSAYDALINETKDQFKHMLQSGLQVTKIQAGQENPYKTSKDLFNDVKNNNHIAYFPTDQGFGSGDQTNDHPMLQPTEHLDNEGKPMAANDIFRIVHDYFGHAKEGNGFGANGEEGAWKHHMQMYSPLAQKALTAETRGQNSWVNFGPHGEENRKNPANTKYADQKATLLPDFAHQHGEQSVYSQLHKNENDLIKGLSHDELKSKGYRFRYLNPTKQRDYYVVAAYHGSKKAGHVLYSKSPDKTGYHYVPRGHVEEAHRGQGLYQNMLKLAAQHVKTLNPESKGLTSKGYQRSMDATHAWDKVATHAEEAQDYKIRRPQYRADYFIKNLSGKHLHRLEIIQKGAMNRIAPYDPNKHISPDDHKATENWTSEGDDQDARANVPEMHANAKVRALHKLGKMTEVRRHPKTNERMFLLHRGMSSDEHELNHRKGVSNYAPATMTSWTPHYHVAKGFASDHATKYDMDDEEEQPQQAPVVSAWIPESEIHNIPNATMIPDENQQFRNEHEIVVNHRTAHPHAHPNIVKMMTDPHNPKFKPDINRRINQRAAAQKKAILDKYGHNSIKADMANFSKLKRATEYKQTKFGKREAIMTPTLAKGDISDKIKTGIAGLAVAASTLAPMNTNHQRMDNRMEQVSMQQPQNARKERILSSIMDVESSGGRNKNHKAMPKTHALHQGEKAYGSYGLMPLIIRETVKKNPQLKEHNALLTLKGDALHSYMNKNPKLEKQIADAHYDRLAKQFGDDPQKIGYAWLNGITGTHKAMKEKRPLDKHFYVKRILDAYSKHKKPIK